MTGKLVVRRLQANVDIDDAVNHYLTEADDDLAERFVDDVDQVFELIAAAPGAGSPRFGEMLDLPGLRSHRLRKFPYLVFYMEGAIKIEVWRVLHERRDIAGALQDTA